MECGARVAAPLNFLATKPVSMPSLLLRETDIDNLLDMPLAIEVMHAAFLALASEEADNVPRVRAKAPGVVLHSLIAAAAYLDVVGWKQYVTTRSGAKFLAGLNDARTGELLALIEADRLGQLRTGAVTGLAARQLANPKAETVGIIGAGYQAQTQLEAVAAVCPIRQAFVYSRSAEHRESFAKEMSAKLKIEVTPVDDPRKATEYQPIVVTATTSKDPVFEGKWLSPGTLVCAVGSNWLHKAEIDVDTFAAAQLIVCDSIAACQAEAGDFIQPLAQGVFHWENAVEFSAIVAGTNGRRSLDHIVIFKSVGLAIEDVALGAKALELAKQRGLGESLPL
jgi:ornithine cyclodeaminase/alanine dehydrogenase-like protein (mu-crystallin family)